MMRASKLNHKQDYPSFPEFIENDINLNRVNAALIVTLQSLRDKTGIPIYPSPVPGAWARTDGSETSRHYAVGRLSDAGDIFPERGRYLELLFRVQQLPNIGGIGIYADTNGLDGHPWPMMHIDMRQYDLRVLWARDGDYHTLNSDPVGFARVLQKIIEMED